MTGGFIPQGDQKVPSSQDERRLKELCSLEALLLSFSSVYSGGEICFFLTLEVLGEQPFILFYGWLLDECAGVPSPLLTFIHLSKSFPTRNCSV